MWGGRLCRVSPDTCSMRAPCLVQTEPVVGQTQGSRGSDPSCAEHGCSHVEGGGQPPEVTSTAPVAGRLGAVARVWGWLSSLAEQP